MRNKFFASLASLHVGFMTLSLFLFEFPALQFTPTPKAESVMTEFGANFPWIVERGETMSSIAEKWYGDTSFVTTMWNDNPWIEDPANLEEGWVLEMRYDKPILPEPLSPELAERQRKIQYGYVRASLAKKVQAQPVAQPVVVATSHYSGGPLTEAQLTYLGQCEAGMDPTKNTGNGYYGAFQFSYGTWKSMNTGYERADMAPLEVQKDAVQRLLSRSSIFTQFPGCARKMQSLGMI
jgi:hypothetical protein